MKVWHKSNTIRAALLAVGSAVAALPALGPALADETIKIGVPMSLSGRFVSYGASGKRGVEMAAEAFGSTINGRKIEFLYRDVQSDPQATMSAVNELINSQDVDFLIGPTASPIAAAAIPPWQQGKPIWILNGGLIDNGSLGATGWGRALFPYVPLLISLSYERTKRA